MLLCKEHLTTSKSTWHTWVSKTQRWQDRSVPVVGDPRTCGNVSVLRRADLPRPQRYRVLVVYVCVFTLF